MGKIVWILGLVTAILVMGACTGHNNPHYNTRTEAIFFTAAIDGKTYNLQALLYTPYDYKEKRSAVVMNHGRNGPNPPADTSVVYQYREICTALAERGFLVMMLARRGYGRSDGPDSEFLDTAEESGLAGAKDVKAAVEYIRTRPDVDKDHVVIIGQSQGGWISLASSTLDIAGVLGTINISGATNFRQGQGKPLRSSEVEGQLQIAAAAYGKAALVPTLWIYAENDNHTPDSVRKWFNAYTKAGGRGRLVVLPPYYDNGHYVVQEPERFMNDILNFIDEIGFGK